MIKTALAATALAALTFALPAQAITVVKWDFESATAPVAAGTTWTSIAASTGTGTASGVHASAATAFSTPSGNGSPKSASANTWSVGDYWQFTFSTTGYTGLTLSFDQTGSSTGPRDFTLAYSTDGTSFTNFTTYSLLVSTWNTTTVASGFTYTSDLSAVSTLNGKSAVFIRLIDNSTNSIGGGTVATGGTDRVDNFIVNLTPVPEAGTSAMLFAGLAVLVFLARRRNGA